MLQCLYCSFREYWGVKTHQNYIDRNLKMDGQILIIFGMNIPETTGHQMIIYVSVAPYVCFCTTWGKQNK